MDMVQTRIDCLAVHVYDVLTFFLICLCDRILHVAFRFLDRNDVSQLEESSLQDGVRSACAQTDLFCHGHCVAGIELHIVLRDVSLDLAR